MLVFALIAGVALACILLFVFVHAVTYKKLVVAVIEVCSFTFFTDVIALSKSFPIRIFRRLNLVFLT